MLWSLKMSGYQGAPLLIKQSGSASEGHTSFKCCLIRVCMYNVKFSYFAFKLEQVMDGKFGGASFKNARSPMKSYPSDDSNSIPPEQPKLDLEIESDDISNTPSEFPPQLAVDLESETRTDGGSSPAIRMQKRRRILQEARRRRQYQEARWRKQNKDSACKLMLHMMEHAKTSSKDYLKNLYESFNRGQGQLCILFLILLN